MRGMLAQLSPHEENTLRRIARGEASRKSLRAVHVARLERLALVEDVDGRLRLTDLGHRRHANLDRPETWLCDPASTPVVSRSTH